MEIYRMKFRLGFNEDLTKFLPALAHKVNLVYRLMGTFARICIESYVRGML